MTSVIVPWCVSFPFMSVIFCFLGGVLRFHESVIFDK